MQIGETISIFPYVYNKVNKKSTQSHEMKLLEEEKL